MRFEDKIRCLSMVFRINVISWIRDRSMYLEHDAELHEPHQLGLAVDVMLGDGMQKHAFIARAVSLDLQCIERGDHIHVQEPRG